MPANFIDLDSIEKLDRLFKASHDQPVVIFKHSLTCGISSGVYTEVRGVTADLHLVIMQEDRPISNEIAARTGLRHESPQAIVLSRGLPIYHASHYDITAEDIERSLAYGRDGAAAAV